MGRILAIDLGEVRTGFAISSEIGGLACGITTVRESDFEALAGVACDYIKQYKASRVVIGLPVNMDGSHGFACERAERFTSILRERTDAAIELFDERCTTMLAHRIMNTTDTRGKKRKASVDTLSAEIILQNYLDAHPELT